VGVVRSRDLLKFWEISDNILKMVQDRDIVTIKDYSKTRRRSGSAYIRQVNFLQLLCRAGEEDGAPLKLNLYLKMCFRNNRP